MVVCKQEEGGYSIISISETCCAHSDIPLELVNSRDLCGSLSGTRGRSVSRVFYGDLEGFRLAHCGDRDGDVCSA